MRFLSTPLLIVILLTTTGLHAQTTKHDLIKHPVIRGMLDEVNRERTRHGLPKLTIDPDLSVNAQQWAQYMHRYSHFQHNPRRAGAEVIGYGYDDPADVVRGWMNSPGHRAILLGRYTHAGFGARWTARSYKYWVGVFTYRRQRTTYKRRL